MNSRELGMKSMKGAPGDSRAQPRKEVTPVGGLLIAHCPLEPSAGIASAGVADDPSGCMITFETPRVVVTGQLEQRV